MVMMQTKKERSGARWPFSLVPKKVLRVASQITCEGADLETGSQVEG